MANPYGTALNPDGSLYTPQPVGPPQTDPTQNAPTYGTSIAGTSLNPNDPSYNPLYDPSSPYYRNPYTSFSGQQYVPAGMLSQNVLPSANGQNSLGPGSQTGATGMPPAPTATSSRTQIDAWTNALYQQRYGTAAPQDQLDYWAQKIQNPTQLGNGQMSDASYYAGRLLYDGTPYATGGDTGGANPYGTGNFGAPLFQATSPFSYGQGVPNVGAFSYDPLQTPQSFQLPTGQEALNQDPGYAFRLQQGETALENSAAARGGLGDPNTLRAVQDYGQQSASQEYQNAYSRALQTYQTNTGTNLQAQQQQYAQGQGAYTTNAQEQLQAQQQGFSQALQGYQTNFQDPLAAYQAQVGANLGYGNLGIAQQGVGINQGYLGLAANQQAFNQPYQLAQLGLQGTQGATNANLGYTGQLTGLYGANASAQGNYITGGGNAIAAGQVGSGNAYAGAANNVGQYAGLAAYLAQHQPPQNSGTNNPYAIHN
jgi:hypothetical protein